METTRESSLIFEQDGRSTGPVSDGSSDAYRMQNKPRSKPGFSTGKGGRKPSFPSSGRGREGGRYGGSSYGPGPAFAAHSNHSRPGYAQREQVSIYELSDSSKAAGSAGSPFFFEISERDSYISECTAQALRTLYESVHLDNSVHSYLQQLAATSDQHMLKQQRNVDEFYEKKKQAELSAIAANAAAKANATAASAVVAAVAPIGDERS